MDRIPIDLRIFAPFGSPLFTPHLLFRIIQHFGGEDEDDAGDSHYLPLYQHLREFAKKTNFLDSSLTKYNSNIASITASIETEDKENDSQTVELVQKLITVNESLKKAAEAIQPLVQEQLQTAKALLDYLSPPTFDLFQKKVDDMMSTTPAQLVPTSRQNTCAICMDSTADCIIKRTCNNLSSSSSAKARCEKSACRCGPTMCKNCMFMHYWTTTNKGTKSYSRCILCRADTEQDQSHEATTSTEKTKDKGKKHSSEHRKGKRDHPSNACHEEPKKRSKRNCNDSSDGSADEQQDKSSRTTLPKKHKK